MKRTLLVGAAAAGLVAAMAVPGQSWGAGSVLDGAGPIQGHLAGGAATALADGRVLLTGGVNPECEASPPATLAEVYDPVSNTYASAGSFSRLDHTGTLLANGTVLVAGGTNTTSATKTVAAYRPASNDWVSRAPMRTARTGHKAVRLANGRVLVVGGNTGAATAEIYNPAADAWSVAKPPLSSTAVLSDPVLLGDGRVFVVLASSTAPAQIYNPTTNTWVKAATTTQLPTPTVAAATVLDDGRVFVASQRAELLGGRVDLYTPGTKAWDNVFRGRLGSLRSATTLDSGDVLVGLAGGDNWHDSGYASVLLRYDPVGNLWATAEEGAWRGYQTTKVPGFGVVFTSIDQPSWDCDYGGWATRVYREGYPGRPGIVTVGAGDSSMRVEWTSPTDTGASPITGYTVYLKDVNNGLYRTQSTAGTTRSVTFSALPSGGTFFATVEATNTRGTGLPQSSTAATVGTTACTVTGTSGADTLTGTSGRDVICGLGGDDVIRASYGSDVLIGGSGVDTLDFTAAPGGITANLATGVATGWGTQPQTLREIENLTGSDHPDSLTGDSALNVLKGRSGNDTFGGSDGADLVYGGGQDDTFELSAPFGWAPGLDDGLLAEPGQYFGGLGTDTISYPHTDPLWDYPDSIFVDLKQGRSVEPAAYIANSGQLWGSDKLTEIENVLGSPYPESVIRGSDADNYLAGGFDLDILRGAGGNDTLAGGGGDDQLFGDAGNDALIGGADTDTCNGGTGTDTGTGCETKVSIP